MGLPVDEPDEQPFWALHDVSFTVQRGEMIGIMGRNGAGKTTLLRVMSQITAPTTGNVTIQGHYATLLSLGAGFSPHLSGRHNIYLNAAIQGWHPRDTDEIINEIIEFSELDEAIERPVKVYSSGMVTRLGFSIAIHTLPDVIFLDEILAVGDAAFKEKCMERILDLKNRKVTLLYVSHAIGAIKTLCERSLLIDKGEVVSDGPTEEVIEVYKELLPHQQKSQSGVKPPVPANT